MMTRRMRYFRELNHMTLSDLAEASKISRGMIIKLERGERGMTLEYLTILADVFKVPVAEMVGEADPESARHISEWHEDCGDVLWWHPGEAPWIGSPLTLGKPVRLQIIGATEPFLNCDFDVAGWPGYHEWWTPLPPPPAIPAPPETGKSEEGT